LSGICSEFGWFEGVASEGICSEGVASEAGDVSTS
ncbi:hypothetical protein A2U01_0112666, partial [Trifolium medium]|nr:hypothetical protein [Trifolium medium]